MGSHAETTDGSAEHLKRPWLFAAAAVGMLTFGMIVALLGTLFGLPAFRARLGVDFAQQGDLFGILSFGLMAGSVVAGPALHRFGAKPILGLASALATTALLAFAFAQGFGAAALAALMLGLGGSWLNISTNALVSDVFPEDRGRMLNLLGAFFGIGALLVPLIVAVGFERLSVAGTIAACAAIAALCATLCLALRFPAPQPSATFSFRRLIEAGGYPGIALLAVLLFAQSGNEASLSGWVSSFVGSAGWSPRTATVILLGYWVLAVVGRSASARAQALFGKPRLVLFSGLAAVAGCLMLLVSAGSLAALTTGAWVSALAFSAIFPTTLAMAGDRYPQATGTVFGFLFAISNLGSMLFPWAVGHVSQAAGLRLGMIIPLAGAVAVAACAAIAARRFR